MMSLRKRDQGFTIIELLVVTLVIVGLGFLMLNSMSDIRARDHDTERRADLNLIHQQLEFYYDLGETNVYPTLANLQDDAWVSKNMKALTAEALKDPQGVEIGAEGSDYKYEPKDCGKTGCAGYSLSANQEKSTPDPYVHTNVKR